MSRLFETLLLIVIVVEIKSFEVEPHPDDQDIVIIHNFRWPDDAAEIKKIPNKKKLYFESAVVDILPDNFTDQFEKCDSVGFVDGVVKSVLINPKIKIMSLTSTSTENVIIERGKEYQIEEFICQFSNLQSIPENMRQLKKLRLLSFLGNSIETVSLSELEGLDNLEELILSANRIKQIQSHGSVSFPSLTKFYLGSNQLQHLEVCGWKMPKLSLLYLYGNKLTHFAVNNFRNLSRLEIFGNPLNCAWGNRLQKDKPGIIDWAFSCDEKSVGDFDLDCPLNLRLSQLEESVDRLSREQDSNFDVRLTQLEERLSTKLTQIDQRISDVHNRVELRQQDSNINIRLTQIAKGFSKMEERIAQIEKGIDQSRQHESNINTRFSQIEESFSKIDKVLSTVSIDIKDSRLTIDFKNWNKY